MNDYDEIPVRKKVWGEEHWIVNREYCGKKLILRRGFRSSIHYHEEKDETFYVISGKILMERSNCALRAPIVHKVRFLKLSTGSLWSI